MSKLTKTIVDHAKAPVSGQAFLCCSNDRGFGVRINASGSRTFIAQGRVNGKVRGHRSAATASSASIKRASRLERAARHAAWCRTR
jgi:hypothetical protein